MEFNEKLQELRKQRGLTQEELAEKLYVSRTAISKWESGRGYPNIESLKAIAKFFSVTVDDLLSTDEVLTIAEEDSKRKEKHFRDLIYGLLDICIAMLLFLPFFAEKADGIIQRKLYPVVPPKTEYSLTERGKRLIPSIIELNKWGLTYLKEMDIPCAYRKE